MAQLSDFTRINKYIQPPGYQGTYNRHVREGEDEARYILKPDHQFDRPWLASPQGKGGIAFVWPLGVQGFEFTSSATAGIHHYIGENDVHIDIVYPDEFHIILNGIFPGKTAARQIPYLRQVILHDADPPGLKLLSMPPALANIYHVRVINHSFNHDQNDNTRTVNYSIEFIKSVVGVRAQSTVDSLPEPDPSSSQLRGKSTRRYTVKSGARSFPALSKILYGDTDIQSQIQLWYLNEEELEKLGIQLYKIPYATIPTGTVIHY